MQSYLVVFIGYMTIYLIRKNFNVAQNDMIETYGLTKTELGMIRLGFSVAYGIGKTVVSYYADGKNTKQFVPFMLILSALYMLGISTCMGVVSHYSWWLPFMHWVDFSKVPEVHQVIQLSLK